MATDLIEPVHAGKSKTHYTDFYRYIPIADGRLKR